MMPLPHTSAQRCMTLPGSPLRSAPAHGERDRVIEAIEHVPNPPAGNGVPSRAFDPQGPMNAGVPGRCGRWHKTLAFCTSRHDILQGPVAPTLTDSPGCGLADRDVHESTPSALRRCRTAQPPELTGVPEAQEVGRTLQAQGVLPVQEPSAFRESVLQAIECLSPDERSGSPADRQCRALRRRPTIPTRIRPRNGAAARDETLQSTEAGGWEAPPSF